MAIWLQPLLRARQEALEAEGLIQNTDSVNVTIQKAKETQGLVTKPSIPGTFEVLRGNKYLMSSQF